MQHAAAVRGVDERQVLAGEQIADVRRPQRREDDERVAVGVAGAVVIEVDLVGALADRHLVLEGALRHAAVVVLLEDVHLLHVRLGVLLHHDVHGRREFDVAAHMIPVRVRVDQHRHRLLGDRLDLVEDRLSPSRVLGVDDGDAVRRDEDGGVAAAALQHVEVVLHLVHVDDFRSVRVGGRRLRLHHRQSAEREEHAEHDSASHEMPPGKKTRWMNQNAPAAITTIDPAQRGERRRDEDHDQELPDLDADVEREERPAERARGQIHLAQHAGEAEAVYEAERERDPRADVAAVFDQQVVGADVNDAERDRRLDDPRRRADDVQRLERERDAVRDGERGHDHRELADRTAEQQQADEKQQVIGADQDVMDAGRKEFLDHRQRALPRAREVLEPRAAVVENRLRLVLRVVRKHPRRDGDGARPLRERKADGKPQRLAVGEHVRREPLGCQRSAVSGHRQTAGQHFRHVRRSREGDGGIQQPLRRLDVQIVRRVENVDDERAFNRIALDPQIEIAERDRMRGCGARQPERRDDHDGRTQNPQNTQSCISLRSPRVLR